MDHIGKILIIVENLPVPLDTRVWLEANTLTEEGYKVSIICPAREGYEKRYEKLNDISIYRHWMPKEGKGILSYMAEYITALFWELVLSFKICLKKDLM